MELLKKLTQTDATSSCENLIHNLIKEEIEPYVDEIYTDALKNLIARKKGTGPRAMVCAHADEIGVMVTYIEENGYLKFTNVGGIGKFVALYQRVRFANGTIGVVSYEYKTEGIKALELRDMYIDIGAKNREEAEKLVSIGDTAAFCGDFTDLGDNVISKAMDDRVAIYILIDVIKNMKESPYDVYFVFTSQEEVGIRGARASSFDINPYVALAVDVTDTGDTPGCPRMAVKLGEGACIKVIDNSVMCSKSVRDHLSRLAEEKDIKVQYEVLQNGGTDAGAINVSRGGVLTGGVSLPTRYIHTPSEMINKNDVKECSRLVCAFLENELESEN